MSLRFINATTCINTSFFISEKYSFGASLVAQMDYMDRHHILFIHSSTDGHWDVSMILMNINNAIMNICVQVFAIMFSFFLGMYLGTELLGHVVGNSV